MDKLAEDSNSGHEKSSSTDDDDSKVMERIRCLDDQIKRFRADYELKSWRKKNMSFDYNRRSLHPTNKTTRQMAKKAIITMSTCPALEYPANIMADKETTVNGHSRTVKARKSIRNMDMHNDGETAIDYSISH